MSTLVINLFISLRTYFIYLHSFIITVITYYHCYYYYNYYIYIYQFDRSLRWLVHLQFHFGL